MAMTAGYTMPTPAAGDGGAGERMPFTVRPATTDDLDAVLLLNTAWEHVTSPLGARELEHLYSEAEYLHVVETGGEIAGFLMAFRSGARYDSPNYRWFESGGDDFLYIDRIVIAADFQRCGLGDTLYDDAVEYARGLSIPRVVCEVDVEPLNRASDAFHRRRGFRELATQWVAGGKKQVSLRECAVRAAG